MTLDLFIVLEREEVDKRVQEASLNDRGLVLGVDGNIANAGSSGEDKREVAGLEEAEERSKTIGFDNLELILLYGVIE
jgi:hypothetical protein